MTECPSFPIKGRTWRVSSVASTIALLFSHPSNLFGKSEGNTEDASNISHSHCIFTFPNTSSCFTQTHSGLAAILASYVFLTTHNSGQQLPLLLANSLDSCALIPKDCKISSKLLTVFRAFPHSFDGPHSLSSHVTSYHTDRDCLTGIPLQISKFYWLSPSCMFLYPTANITQPPSQHKGTSTFTIQETIVVMEFPPPPCCCALVAHLATHSQDWLYTHSCQFFWSPFRYKLCCVTRLFLWRYNIHVYRLQECVCGGEGWLIAAEMTQWQLHLQSSPQP